MLEIKFKITNILISNNFIKFPKNSLIFQKKNQFYPFFPIFGNIYELKKKK
jgi:hypothetical protein